MREEDTGGTIISPALIRTIRVGYTLPWYGLHGIGHWARVRDIGLRLATRTGASRAVVELFAIFHDACRRNDAHDPEHGRRGAECAASLLGTRFHLADEEFALLHTACTDHTNGLMEADRTIQTCWDADRLDLGRVGIVPDPERLCTDAAKNPAMIRWAVANSRASHAPSIVHQVWDRWMREGSEMAHPAVCVGERACIPFLID